MLKYKYAKQEDIPSNHVEFYAEKDGAWVLQVEGGKTPEDFEKLNKSLDNERKEHKKTKEALGKWGDLNPDEAIPLLDKVPELEAAASGKLDEEKINDLVEKRIKTRMGPLERENHKLKTDLGVAEKDISEYKAKETKRIITDAVRSAASTGKIIESAVEDVLLLGERVFEVNEDGKVLTKEGVGITPGVDATVWLTEMQEKRPHWWPQSQGSGAGGSGKGGGGFANNPFSAEHWNMTEQGKIVKENPQRAEQMAKAAGTKIGGVRPIQKK